MASAIPLIERDEFVGGGTMDSGNILSEKLDNKYYVDGGLTNHYPIDFFKDDIKHTFGMLVTTEINADKSINNIKDYLVNITSCSFCKIIEDCYLNYKENTVLIEDNTNFLDFNIDYNAKLTLIENAYLKTNNFISTEEFKHYYL